MQIDRLLETIMLLLKYKKITTKELAKRFGVSRRTIYRDIDTLTLAGIPVYCVRGNCGGVYIDETYLLERNFLTVTEKEQLEIGVYLLKAAGLLKVETVMDKVATPTMHQEANWLQIELHSSYPTGNFDAILSLLKKAIIEERTVEFQYRTKQEQILLKTVAPVKVLYQQNSWKLHGYCQDNDTYQLYDILSISNMTIIDSPYYIEKPIVYPKEDTVQVRLKFDKRIGYKMYAEFQNETIYQNADGSYEMEMELINDKSLYLYILSFGSNIEIISPLWLKQRIRNTVYSFLENNQI